MTTRFLFPLAAVIALTLPLAPGQANDAARQEVLPASGMRFVVRTFSGEPLNRLYAVQTEKGGKLRPVELMLHPRKPSRRVRWDAERRVQLYKEEPGAMVEDSHAETLKPEELPPPFLTATAPEQMSGKITALIAGNAQSARIFYFDEQVFSKGGLHAINFTATPIQITVFQKPDQSDKRVFVLTPYSNRKGLVAENIWHFVPRNGQRGTYGMTIYALQPSGERQRLRSTRFTLSPDMGQINVFLKDPKGMYSMDSISITP